MGTSRFTGFGSTGTSNISSSMALPGDYSFGHLSSLAYNPGYMSGYPSSYANNTESISTGFRFQNDTSFFNGISLDLGLYDDLTYLSRSAEGASRRPFILTDPHYFIDGEKENERRDVAQIEIDEEAAFLGL